MLWIRVTTAGLLVAASAGCKPQAALTQLADSGGLTVTSAIRSLETYACPTGNKVKVAFFDADSTLRVSRSGSVSANGPRDAHVLPFVGAKIKELNAKGYLVAIASNQGGIAAGAVSFEDAAAALVYTASLVARMGGRVDWIDMADANDEHRKPQPGMARRLAAAVTEHCGATLNLGESFMVGDSGYKRGTDGPHPDGRPADDFSNADRGFAQNVFAPGTTTVTRQFYEPTDYFGWRQYGVYNIENRGELIDFIMTLERTGKADDAAEAKSLLAVNELATGHRFVHYNIKEFTTAKITSASHEQTKTAAEVVRELRPDLLSINEIQYDLPDTPTQGEPGTGKNMDRFVAKVGLDGWQVTFGEANTGKRAKRAADGNYITNPNAPGAAQLVDQISFGSFPGQYATGFATRFPITKRHIDADVKWKDFEPQMDFSGLTLPNGQAVPADMELFDKNFNHSVVSIDGKDLHVVTFHTVPAFGFGGSAAFNEQRNRAQLEFLAWFLVGSCSEDGASGPIKRCSTDWRPLDEDAPFIAVGDLNVELTAAAPGAGVLKRLYLNERLHKWRPEAHDPALRHDESGRSHVSYLSDGIDLGKLQSGLDYFLVSKTVKILGGRVASPLSGYKEISCHPQKPGAQAALSATTIPAGKVGEVSTRYADDGSRTYCVVVVNSEFKEFRRGSDHLPMYLSFDL